ncbi:MAG TPA: hypothetical protein DDZ90_04245 [Planctomycetaceae bacterium]|nr:hypothetical protein [Planctomycetaceae bacterium]
MRAASPRVPAQQEVVSRDHRVPTWQKSPRLAWWVVPVQSEWILPAGVVQTAGG